VHVDRQLDQLSRVIEPPAHRLGVGRLTGDDGEADADRPPVRRIPSQVRRGLQLGPGPAEPLEAGRGRAEDRGEVVQVADHLVGVHPPSLRIGTLQLTLVVGDLGSRDAEI
jgi:hypothetical protein